MKIALLTKTAKAPTRNNNTDAGIDLYADFYGKNKALPVSRFTHYELPLWPGDCIILPTGVTAEIPTGYFGWITNKSRNDYLVGGGIVDEGYQGELLVKVVNPTKESIIINHHDAIAQLLIISCQILGTEIVELSDIHQKGSDRGIDGGIARQGGFDTTTINIPFQPIGDETWYPYCSNCGHPMTVVNSGNVLECTNPKCYTYQVTGDEVI